MLDLARGGLLGVGQVLIGALPGVDRGDSRHSFLEFFWWTDVLGQRSAFEQALFPGRPRVEAVANDVE